MVELQLIWPGTGSKKVQLAGEFTQWQPREAELVEGRWQIKVQVNPGRYLYKWIVDGDWTVDGEKPTVDENGILNNVLEVEDTDSSGDSDSWERVSVDECAPNKLKNPETKSSSDPAEKKTEEEEEAEDASVDLEKSAEQEEALIVPEQKKLLTKTDSGCQPVLFERIFRPGTGFEEKISSLGTKTSEDRFVDVHFDTTDYRLLRKGVWLKQRHGKWQTRFMTDKRIEISEDLPAIEQRLQSALEETRSLEDLVQERLGEKMRFEGRYVSWLIEETGGSKEAALEVEFRQEGGVETVKIRGRGEVKTTLAQIGQTARELGLLPFKI